MDPMMELGSSSGNIDIAGLAAIGGVLLVLAIIVAAFARGRRQP